jgi:ABC-2 type transport system permease protein
VTLWTLEVLRLTRTNRWMILVGVFGFFGLLGPLTARHFGEIMGRFGGEIEIVIPDPTPLDGLLQYTSNASQLGILAVVVVAAAALALDARPEAAAFFRTRVPETWRLLAPRYAVVAAASIASFAAGTLIAWAGTVWLIGSLPAGEVVLGMLLGGLYLAFVVAVVAVVASVTRTVVTTVFAALAVLVALPILALVGPIEAWVPSELLGATTEVVAGVPPREFVPAIATTLVAVPLLLALAAARQARREL